MTNQEYHSKTDYISKSLLDQIHKSPAHYLAYIQGEKQPPTPAMVFGSLVHSLVFNQGDFAVIPEGIGNTEAWKEDYKKYLQCIESGETPKEAELFGALMNSMTKGISNYDVKPDLRTKEGRLKHEFLISNGVEIFVTKKQMQRATELYNFITESEGKELIVTSAQFEQATAIKEAVLRHPKAALLIEQGQAELPVFGEIEGLPARCKVDFLNTRFNVCIDLKTTQSAAPDEFSRSVWNYRYHVQAAFYLDLTKASRFIFIAVDKEAPYNVELYELDNEAIERGRKEYKQDIELLKKCKETGIFHGYTEDSKIHIISLPNWAK